MQKIDKVLEIVKDTPRAKNNSSEHQMYGVYLGDCLDDKAHYSLYIRLAKTLPRSILEEALSFCKEYHSARSKGRVFMWKLKQLKEQLKEKAELETKKALA